MKPFRTMPRTPGTRSRAGKSERGVPEHTPPNPTQLHFRFRVTYSRMDVRELGMHGFSRAGSLALMAVVGILCVFLHPVAIGPAVVMHSQTTAFRALVAARQVFAAMRAAFGISAGNVCARLQKITFVPSIPSVSASLYALRC